MLPQFAIAILSYNHPEITAKCIESVLKLHSSESIFLTHNGSLPQHCELLKNQFPQIQHIFVKENKGYTQGVNITLQNVFKKYEDVLFLTNDTELLQLNIEPPEQFSSIKILKRNSDKVDSVMGALNPQKGSLRHLKNMNDLKNNELLYVPGAAFWMPKSVFEKNGLFDLSFHTYWEDVDYSLRMQKNNFKLNYDSKTICKHKIGKTCHKNRFYTFELYQRNRGLCLRKNNLTTLIFYFYYIRDLIKHSRSDFKLGFKIFRQHFSGS